jgi:periplasmic divalent cation tolerance protein
MKRTVPGYIIVYATVPDEESGSRIALTLLEKQLCACVLIIDANNTFWWDPKLNSSTTKLLLIKTKKSLFPRIAKEITTIHPYELPAIMCSSMITTPQYAQFIDKYTVE